MKRFCEYLKTRKPVMGMLHLAGANGRDMLARALRETETYFQCGVDAVLVENYFGSARDCESVLRELRNRMPGTVYGVGAGVTIDTVQESLAVCDGAIVGSWFKEGHHDTGEVNANYVKAFMVQARNAKEGTTDDDTHQ